MARLLTYDGQVIDPTACIYIYTYISRSLSLKIPLFEDSSLSLSFSRSLSLYLSISLSFAPFLPLSLCLSFLYPSLQMTCVRLGCSMHTFPLLQGKRRPFQTPLHSLVSSTHWLEISESTTCAATTLLVVRLNRACIRKTCLHPAAIKGCMQLSQNDLAYPTDMHGDRGNSMLLGCHACRSALWNFVEI